MEKNSKIFVTGHRGLVGSAISRSLREQGYNNIIERTSKELDLRDQSKVQSFFKAQGIDYVFLVAAKVGGILANSNYPADFIYDNLMIESNVIKAAADFGVKKLLFLGSACIYPKVCEQPIKEEYLLSGYLEPSNKPYAIAKIAGLELCSSYRRQYGKDFICAMPTNLYGPNDNFDLENSHVFPAMVRKFYEAVTNKSESITLWGDGTPTREFLHVQDLAEACIYLMNNYSEEDFLNIGTSEEVSIKELAEIFKEVTGYDGELVFDTSKPNGTPRRKMDISKISSKGWVPRISLKDGIKDVYDWYCENPVK